MSRTYSDDTNVRKVICIEKFDESFIEKIVHNLTLTQRFLLRVNGSLEIGRFIMVGWIKELPFYLFQCKEHGYQINYPYGYGQKLVCPECIKIHNLPVIPENQKEPQPVITPQI